MEDKYYEDINFIDVVLKIGIKLTIEESAIKAIRSKYTIDEKELQYNNKSCIIIGGKSKLLIIQCPDEWFYVRVDNKSYKDEYYKCDQLDGLLKCLEDII